MPDLHWTPRQSGFIHERQNLDQEIDEPFPAIPLSNAFEVRATGRTGSHCIRWVSSSSNETLQQMWNTFLQLPETFQRVIVPRKSKGLKQSEEPWKHTCDNVR